MSHPPVPRDGNGVPIPEADPVSAEADEAEETEADAATDDAATEGKDLADADPAAEDAAPDAAVGSFAQMSNQQRLYRKMRTYPESDSNSYIAPYVVKDHAWTVSADAEGTLPHYDVYNETHWVDQSMNDGYKIPITADDGDSLVQRKSRTYPEADSNSYIAPYVSPAWTVTADAEGTLPHYDVYNETHWVDQSMVDGYKVPITADDGNSLVQKASHGLEYVSRKSLAKVAEINDHNWLCDVRDEDGKPMYIHSYEEYYHCAVLGRVTPDDILGPAAEEEAEEEPTSFVQKTVVSNQALAQVATLTRDYNWLCDVRGEDGRPFYVASYGEYAHCAEMFRVNADDNLH